MSFLPEQINIIAVILVGILSMVIGALWYSPFLFGNLWLRLINKTTDEIEARPTDYIFSFIAALLASLMLGILIGNLEITQATEGILIGLLVGIGFSATSTLTYSTFEGPPYSVWALYTVYQLLWYGLAGLILAVWQ